MKSYLLTLSTPDGNRFQGQALFLSLRGAEGDLAIMADHTPFITSVLDCDVHIETAEQTDLYGHTQGGLLTVAPEGVTLLSGNFTWQDEHS